MQSRLFALLAVLAVPFCSSAQSWDYPGRTASPSQNSALAAGSRSWAANTVSVRELSIPEKARRSFYKGNQLLATGDAQASIKEFQKAITDFHSYYEAYYQLGAAQLALGLTSDATDSFSKSIQISGGRFALPYFSWSMILSHDLKFAEGDTLAKTGLSLDPDSILGQFSLSWAEFGLGRPVVAERLLREVLKRKPDFREALHLLIEVHRYQKNLPELIADVDTYLKLDSDGAMSAHFRALREEAVRRLAQAEESKSLTAATAQPRE